MMSVGTETQSETAAIDDPPYLLTSTQFFEMIEAGVFPEEARVYLREGRIVQEMAKTKAHSVLGSLIASVLIRALPPDWCVFPEGEFEMDESNTRLPDLSVVRGADPREYLREGRRLHASDIALVVEIAVTSLARDLGPNLRRYAQSMIPAYWVADVCGKQLVVHTEPRITNGQCEYGRVLKVVAGHRVPLVLDGQEVATFAYEDLMP